MTSITIIISSIVIASNILLLLFQGRRIRNVPKLKLEIWDLKCKIARLEYQNKVLQTFLAKK